ncbi:hypothetical protein F5148DRAFT_1378016 [Russula earlei]|uniref:Uncharacterized protein n=1 Tax=Russula earlei TaxID=71964 RepID=A0ACC0U205_9AGAM|nr:hypothetical protein F5148DRAFT_1378016 [Russula earlei]
MLLLPNHATILYPLTAVLPPRLVKDINEEQIEERHEELDNKDHAAALEKQKPPPSRAIRRHIPVDTSAAAAAAATATAPSITSKDQEGPELELNHHAPPQEGAAATATPPLMSTTHCMPPPTSPPHPFARSHSRSAAATCTGDDPATAIARRQMLPLCKPPHASSFPSPRHPHLCLRTHARHRLPLLLKHALPHLVLL